MEIKLTEMIELDGWMNLVGQVKDSFPGLETSEAMEEHRNTVIDFINRKSSICAKDGNRVVGSLLFSKKENMLCFLAVSPEYRRKHIAEKLVNCMLKQIDNNKKVLESTYCEGVPDGVAARAFYKRMGFVEGEIGEEFGSPVQTFILHRECVDQ